MGQEFLTIRTLFEQPTSQGRGSKGLGGLADLSHFLLGVHAVVLHFRFNGLAELYHFCPEFCLAFGYRLV